MSTASSPVPIALADIAALAVEVFEATRDLPIARQAHMVAAYLDYEVNRLTGQELRELRSEAGLSQVELARRLGISQPAVSDMERDRRPVTAEAALLARRLAAWSRRQQV